MFFKKEGAEGEKGTIDLGIRDIVTSVYSYWEENFIYSLPFLLLLLFGGKNSF